MVVRAYDRSELLDRCLASLAGLDVVVVDDASSDPDAVRRVAEAHRARLICHTVNRAPAAARNTGLAATRSPFVAFIDSDCVATADWLAWLMPLFDDPRVGVVAPRVVPREVEQSLLGRHEQARSALDMGRYRRLVRPGGALGFLPSAALVIRRSAMDGHGFDPALRMGEDVDLVWRLNDLGLAHPLRAQGDDLARATPASRRLATSQIRIRNLRR